MNIKNNIKIERIDDQARGICFIDNKITFVPNTLIGEIVDIEIIKETSKYNIGKVKKYIKISEERIEVKCPFYNECGGCNLLHTNYTNSVLYKKDKLKNILSKFAGIDIDIEFIENKNIFNYRNKVDLKIVNSLWGYFNSNTHDFVNIDNCLLVNNEINKVIENKDLFNIKSGNIVIRCNYNNEILIAINSSDEVSIDIDSLKVKVKLVGIVVNDQVYYGEKYFIESVNNKLFKVNYNSFFQINPYITNKMIEIIEDNIVGENILDLYCGVGFLGQVISNKVNKIYGIEINQNSILDAISNANMNRLDNTYYMCGDSSKLIDKIKDNIDTVIIDPPRTGLYKNMYDDLIRISSDRIIYVSCDPITLARDLKELNEYYIVDKIYGMDMFSNTYHIESIAILNKRLDEEK